jgi:hypothetical protein
MLPCVFCTLHTAEVVSYGAEHKVGEASEDYSPRDRCQAMTSFSNCLFRFHCPKARCTVTDGICNGKRGENGQQEKVFGVAEPRSHGPEDPWPLVPGRRIAINRHPLKCVVGVIIIS